MTRPLREVIAEIVAPHMRGMTSISPDNETAHRNREYALSVADSVIAALPQSSSVQIEPLLAFIGEVERQDSDLPEPSSADMAEISTHVEQYISELESIIDSHRERARAILAALPQTEVSETVQELIEALTLRDARFEEILEWVREETEVGTAYECECGHSTYHRFNKECENCGRDFPFLDLLCFKLGANVPDEDSPARQALALPVDGEEKHDYFYDRACWETTYSRDMQAECFSDYPSDGVYRMGRLKELPDKFVALYWDDGGQVVRWFDTEDQAKAALPPASPAPDNTSGDSDG